MPSYKQTIRGAEMSFRDTLSNIWNNLQYKLFPQLEEDIGELSTELKNLASILELIRIERHVPDYRFNPGRPCEDRIFIARAYVAKIVLKIPFTNQLVKRLKIDKQLRFICGWENIWDIPSESKFCRVFNDFAKFKLPDIVHQALIKAMYKDKIIGHVVKDSTPLEAREKHLKKTDAKSRQKERGKKYRKIKNGEPNRRQQQLEEKDLNKMIDDLPKLCDKGMKKSAQGYTTIWKGYKLHAAVDDHCIPLAAIITSASLNDCEAAIPLATKASKVATNFYDLMDAAYDHPEIKKHSISLGHVPLIDKCPHNKEQKDEKEKEKERRNLLNFKTAEQIRYKERLPKERFNALYKDFHGGRTIMYKGYVKVSCHVMFGVLVTAASTILKLIQ